VGKERSPYRAELFIGLVGALGAPLKTVASILERLLPYYGYRVVVINVSDLIEGDRPEHEDERIQFLMDEGTLLREKWERGDALALRAIAGINADRGLQAGEPPVQPVTGVAYVVRSLKHPAEVETLRSVYGPRFFLLAGYSTVGSRLKALRQAFSDSYASRSHYRWKHEPEKLLERDQEEGKAFGQKVRATFHLADAFLDVSRPEDHIRDDLQRVMDIVFGDPFKTPSRDEFALFQAEGASRRSAEPGRQVGAAIASQSGSVISLGMNDVPKAGGGQYWEGDEPDAREHSRGHDTNTVAKREIAEDIQRKLLEAGALREGDKGQQIGGLKPDDTLDLILSTRLGDLTEFGRAVHAEMAALLDAAARGVAVAGATLYTTTFPCHNCARHIIGAGIRRLVFLAPYPKSAATDLHDDAIAFPDDESPRADQLKCEPFVGIAPRRYLELFDAGWREDKPEYFSRKTKDGTIVAFDPETASPVLSDLELADLRPMAPAYLNREALAVELLARLWDGGAESAPTGSSSRDPSVVSPDPDLPDQPEPEEEPSVP
jgi:deoxycytidylate deaminase